MTHQTENQISRSVEVVQSIEGWTVHVRDGARDESRTFRNETFAHNWADGQRIRLGLAVVRRPASELSDNDHRRSA